MNPQPPRMLIPGMMPYFGNVPSLTAESILIPSNDPSNAAVQSLSAQEAASLGGMMSSGGGKQAENKKMHLRKAAGEIWSDQTLDEWPDDDYRVFCGDLGNEVTDEVLTNAFRKYPTFQRARVVRDKRSGKSRGYGFVSFLSPEDMLAALKQMNKKYVGNRPIRVMRSKWREREINSDMNKQFSDLFKTAKTSSKTLRKFKRTGVPVTGGKKLESSDRTITRRGRGYFGPGGAARLAHYQYGGIKKIPPNSVRSLQ
ncbi:Rna recognition motif-containing protein [Cardiosporidium cionae]|uniref:Rna recognition motif-containing protein n=1 Tax=Cardiosporidium cionae TaxID=476202 RepID=A0ABQ7JDK2_9APIC|nr:Rna recognition motif-containing protein [Cardiosporidium cionae]|eukprot:KAF8822061.1 Rna recognition motif-containing protein [Cardiosporidium cionae]